MLSTASIFNEIKANDEAYRFFLSIAAKGEAQGGFENARIAELTEDEVLAAKIRRHGEDEAKHGRLFEGLLKKRGLATCAVPVESDYCMMLEGRGIGLRHERLERDEPLSVEEILAYLAHSRVTEQRAMEEVATMVRVFGDDPEVGAAVRMIADDEVNHLSYCHEELERLCAEGHAETISSLLRRYARAEIRAYRDTGRSFVRRMSGILHWSTLKRAVLLFGVNIIYLYERLWGWRRMVRIERPERRNALG